MDDLSELERIAGGLIRQLSAGERRKVHRKMAKTLADSQRQRIAAQRQPDGSGFTPRAEKKPPTPGKSAACFLYPSGGSGAPRKVILKSFVWQGSMMTGYDIAAGGIRSFFHDKVVAHLPVPPEYKNASAGKFRRGGLKRKKMFRKLASARFLRSGADDLGFWVGFTGRPAEVASIHQHGLRDRPSLKARAMTYPKRELIGATAADREALLDAFYAHMAGAMA